MKWLFGFALLMIYSSSSHEWQGGSASVLEGRILNICCFISDETNTWTEQEKLRILSEQDTATRWIQKQASFYKKELSFQHKMLQLESDKFFDALMIKQDNPSRTQIARKLLSEVGFDTRYSVEDWRRDSSDCTQHIITFYVKTKGQGYSLPFLEDMNKRKYYDETSILFDKHLSGKELTSCTIAHEWLHLFGAWDFYQTEFQTRSREQRANQLFPNSIMLRTFVNIEYNTMDEVTAWLIGWHTDEQEWYRWFKPKNL